MTDDGDPSGRDAAVPDLEWDEAKRALNLAKHGLDFLDAVLLMDGPHVVVATHPGTDAVRRKVTGRIGSVYATLVCTPRQGALRVISSRRARDGERRAHQARHGG